MTKHYIAYNKVEDWGEYGLGGTEFRHYSGHPESKLQKMIGETVWVISGERTTGKTVYKLCSVYTPTHLEKIDTGGFWVTGKGHGFIPHIELSGFSWLAELLKEQSNFRYGLNEIKSRDVIRGLEQIRDGQVVEISEVSFPDEIGQPEKHIEGAKKQVTVNAYERNPKARAACIAKYGYKCAVCEFDFEKHYGEIGSGYIHFHHLKPLASVGEKYEVDPIGDLRPVCPNCHAMLHKKEPPYSIEELQVMLRVKFSNAQQ